MKPRFIHALGDDIRRICLFLFILSGLVSGCTPRIPSPAATEHFQAPADFPEDYYRQAKASGSSVLRIDAKRSLVAIEVHRDGALARLGHDHVVASRDVTGYADMTAGRADLFVPLERLTVDEPDLRAEAGLTSKPSEGAIEGTRRNMLEKVLDSVHFPFALIAVTRTTAEPPELAAPPELSVTITLHNSVQTFKVPAQIETVAGGIIISGKMTFRQTDFGITPFSVLGGALQVQDRLDLRFRIFAADSY